MVTHRSGERDGTAATPDVLAALFALDHEKHEFAEVFRAPSNSLSATVARWPKGSIDDQKPHTEDEIYFVLSGRAVLDVAGKRLTAVPGRLLFVAAGVDHSFSEIEADLEVLVVFSPARHTGVGLQGLSPEDRAGPDAK